MLERLVGAINSINTPWVAITVIILGMAFDILCKKWGVANDAATGVIGAGIGLLTGQALNRTPGSQHVEVDTAPPAPLASTPAAPAKEK
jgi:hypothetical protein